MFLKKNFWFDKRHNIRNNPELIEGLNYIKDKSNDNLISLDTTNLFGEKPKEPPLELLRFNGYHKKKYFC